MGFSTLGCIMAIAPGFSKNRIDAKPNVVFILADDMGIECLSKYGGTSHLTPNIDKIAQQGMMFTNCYSNPFSSPSRASLLTGRYPFKNGLKVVLYSRKQEDIFLSPEQPSFARQLKQAGYATAVVGKWHMSLTHKHNTINEFGFDQYQVWEIFDEAGKKRRQNWSPNYIRNGVNISEQIKDRYGPDVDVEFLTSFMKENAAKKHPFMAWYTTCLPHFPWEPTPDSEDKSYRAPGPEHKGDPKYFPDMMKYLDKCIGKVLKTVETLGIADNTIIIFAADNGTDRDLVNLWGDGKAINGGKGTMSDRGTHVPLMMSWKKHIKAGSKCNDLIDFSDMFPTICDLAKASLPKAELHGRSFAPQLFGKRGNPRQWIHIQDGEKRQIRNQNYMLNNNGELRPVVAIWEDEAKPNQNKYPEKEQKARKSLQQAFDFLGEEK